MFQLLPQEIAWRALFFVGLLVLAAYVPLHLWRRVTDRRAPGSPTPALVANAAEPGVAV